MDTELRVRQLLLSVFGLSSIDEILPEASLVKDLGAESLDFVQIIYLVEKDFRVTLRPDDLVSGAVHEHPDSLFDGGKLTTEGARVLNSAFPDRRTRFDEGMTKSDLYMSFTVRDLAGAITTRLKKVDVHA